MKESVVLDSTCLIGLDQINRSELVDKGFRLSEDLRREALHLAGE